jgi:hypothetical protein
MTVACQLCGRDAPTTRHHLVPRSRKKHERETYGALADLCRDCHRKIHATWDNKTVARQYGTIDLLRAAPELQSYLKWIRKKPSSAYFGSRDRKH